MSRVLRRNLSAYGDFRTAVWVREVALRRKAAVAAYLHPCGDVLLYDPAEALPLNPRLLVGVYTAQADCLDIAADIRQMAMEVEA